MQQEGKAQRIPNPLFMIPNLDLFPIPHSPFPLPPSPRGLLYFNIRVSLVAASSVLLRL